jgi:hypothetical protein
MGFFSFYIEMIALSTIFSENAVPRFGPVPGTVPSVPQAGRRGPIFIFLEINVGIYGKILVFFYLL